MRAVLKIETGALTGNEIRLKPGQIVRLGRTSKADLAFPDDSHMSGVHFVVECDERECRIRDLKSRNGTLVNGKRIEAAVLQDRDQIVAGETRFLLRIETGERAASPGAGEKASVGATPPEGLKPEERLLAMLRTEFQPLYAILDAACEPDVFKLLVESKQEVERKRKDRNGDAAAESGMPTASYRSHEPDEIPGDDEAQYESLFEGPPKGQLAHFAPYLVRLPAKSSLLENLVRKGWGKSWGVFLTCDAPFEELRKHLRHFLMVKLPEGKQVYFRFYDPRVLRVYLPTCTADETRTFFGPLKFFLTEGEKPEEAWCFSPGARGVQKTVAPP